MAKTVPLTPISPGMPDRGFRKIVAYASLCATTIPIPDIFFPVFQIKDVSLRVFDARVPAQMDASVRGIIAFLLYNSRVDCLDHLLDKFVSVQLSLQETIVLAF
jgi:hypothetical protein